MPTVPTSGHVSSGTIAADRIRVFRDDEVFQIEPYLSPLAALIQRIGLEEVPNPRYEWLERDRTQRTTFVNGATTWSGTADGATATITVDHNIFKVNNLVYEVRKAAGTDYDYQPGTTTATHWRARVTALNTAVNQATLELVLDAGDVLNETTIQNDAEIMIIGSVYEEFSSRPPAQHVQPTTIFNYIAHPRDSWSIGDYADTLDTYGDPELAEQAEESIGMHRLDAERMIWFSVRSVDSSTGANPRYFTGGVFWRIRTNVFQSALRLSNWQWGNLADDSAAAFELTPGKTKFMFCGQNVVTRMASPNWLGGGGGSTPFASVYLNVDNWTEVLGFEPAMKIVVPHGKLIVIPHTEVFRTRETLAGTEQEWMARELVILDLLDGAIKGVTKKSGRVTKGGIGVIERDIQSTGDHGVMDGVYSYLGLKMRKERWHSYHSFTAEA